ncbi:zinc finger protein 286A [Anabrus simplex]|uniref:zinc finger protein 286A n=1 Tax=Anabrus simplex TaxID=316456 RepID=UPI0035A36A71
MPDYCSVPMCRNQGQPYSYHQFPKEESLRKKWLHAIRRHDLRNKSVSRYIKVCSKHFAVENFVITETGERRRLKKNAVPSIFSWTGTGTLEITPKASRFRSSEAAKTRCVVVVLVAVKAGQHEVAAFEEVKENKPKIQELATEITKELKNSLEMDAPPLPLCSVTIKGEPDETDMDLPLKTSLKTEEIDCKETVIQELVPEFHEELKYSPPVDLSAEPCCSVTVKCEQENMDTDLSFKTSPKMEVDDLKFEMPDDDIDGNSTDGTSPDCASNSMPSSSGAVGELPTIENIRTSKDEVMASSFPISCSRCQSRFKNKYQLRKHRHHSCTLEDAPYLCLQCTRTFQNKCQLRSHLYSDHQIKSEDVVFSCSACNKIYAKRTDFMKHILELHPRVNIHLCPVCNETFPTSWDLHEHLSNYSDDSYSCPTCDLKFPTRTSLEQHMHFEEYTCKKSSMKFYSHSALNQHIKSHSEEVLTCDICYKSYSKRSAFARHLSTHPNDIQGPFTCETCNKEFPRRSHLVLHMATDSGVHSFTCFMCQKSFTKLYDLERHEEIHRKGHTWTVRRLPM